MKHRLLFLCTFILAGLYSAAQPVDASAAMLDVDRVAAENARLAAKRGDAVAAEQFLISTNRAQPNSSWWHIETSQRLIQLAYDVPREGRSTAILSLVTSALQHLSTADSMTTDRRHKASIKALIGRIQERYLGDHAAALATFQAASELAPENPQVRQEQGRLQRMADRTASRAARR